MEKLPTLLIPSFWNNLSAEWKNALTVSFELTETPTLSDLNKMLNSDHLLLNAHSDFEEGNQNIDIKQIQSLKYFTELKEMHLNNTSVKSFTPLSATPSLRKVFLMNCSSIEWDTLSTLVQIDELQLWNCNIDNINWIQKLKKLKRLCLIETQVSEISQISRLENLESLECWGKISYEDQIDRFRRQNPSCEINKLKHGFEMTNFLNSNPEADISDFGYHTIDFSEDNIKWTFENAPDDVKGDMLDTRELIYNFLKFDYFPRKFGNKDVERDRLSFDIEEIEYFVIASNLDEKPIIHYIGCEYYEYFM